MGELGDWEIGALKQGFRYDREATAYVCAFCGAAFGRDEVFPAGNGFVNARGAAARHVADVHGGALRALLGGPKRNTGITPRQAEVLQALAKGGEDRAVAEGLGISASTLRHMRFTFRERARQARITLAALELALEKQTKADGVVPIHEGATMVDERYAVTEEEEAKILKNCFASLDPLVLKALSPKEKKKIVALRRIAGCFALGRRYSEQEVNGILKPIYGDFALVRRYLVEYGFLKRTRDCAAYWREAEV